jgi:hypothetical protein
LRLTDEMRNVPCVRFDASRLLWPRVLGALLLRVPTYRAVVLDQAASLQAGLVVVTTGVLEAVVRASVHGDATVESTSIVYSVLAALIGWMVWSAIVFVVATRVLTRDFAVDLEFRAVTRVVGFAHSPSLLFGLAALPGVSEWAGLVLVVTLAWFVAALAAAVRGLTGAPLGRTLAITGSALLAHEALHQTLRLLGAMD